MLMDQLLHHYLLDTLKEKAYEDYIDLYGKIKNYEILINIYKETIKNYLK